MKRCNVGFSYYNPVTHRSTMSVCINCGFCKEKEKLDKRFPIKKNETVYERLSRKAEVAKFLIDKETTVSMTSKKFLLTFPDFEAFVIEHRRSFLKVMGRASSQERLRNLIKDFFGKGCYDISKSRNRCLFKFQCSFKKVESWLEYLEAEGLTCTKINFIGRYL